MKMVGNVNSPTGDYLSSDKIVISHYFLADYCLNRSSITQYNTVQLQIPKKKSSHLSSPTVSFYLVCGTTFLNEKKKFSG